MHYDYDYMDYPYMENPHMESPYMNEPYMENPYMDVPEMGCLGYMMMPNWGRLAEAYVPYQIYRCFFPLPVGFDKGTIFEELHRPYKRRKF